MCITQSSSYSPAAVIDITTKATSGREGLFWAYGSRGLESIMTGQRQQEAVQSHTLTHKASPQWHTSANEGHTS